MAHTIESVVRDVTNAYLDQIVANGRPYPSLDDIAEQVLDSVKAEFDLENAMRSKGDKWKIPHVLSSAQVGDILIRTQDVVRIRVVDSNTDADYDLIGRYHYDGPDAGVYTTDETDLKRLVYGLKYHASSVDVANVMSYVRAFAPVKDLTVDRDLVAVNNGIFNFATKQLMPFSPDYVFTAKSRVDYNPNAVNVVIHNDDDNTDWDVESWMRELFDTEEETQLMWEITSAVLRPHVRWDVFALFYAETGSNGKGTLCALFRNLCGDGTYASISLSEMGERFGLESVVSANCIITDENDVGVFVDRAANLKALVTGDVIQIDRKFKPCLSFKYRGFMIQCFNEFPRIKDKSDSFYRRQLFVPFTKCFTGHERKYIKEDYLGRREVLEYVMYKALNMNHYSFSKTAAGEAIMTEYKVYNDTVRQFWDETRDRYVWGILPFDFLYAAYLGWLKKNNPSASHSPASKSAFTRSLKMLVEDPVEAGAWRLHPAGYRQWVPTRTYMREPEILIDEYNVDDWMNRRYLSSPDRYKKCVPDTDSRYRALIRDTVVEELFGDGTTLIVNDDDEE